MMARENRSTKRLILGIFSIALGATSLISFLSITYIAGFGILGRFYCLILIALGVGLILPKKETATEEAAYK